MDPVKQDSGASGYPGILWPKFEDQRVGLLLAFIGSINDEILNKDELALELLKLLQEHYPDVLKDRYKIDESSEENLLIQVAKVRGCLAKGGEPDYSRAAALVIDDYRSGKLGRITLEFPPVKKMMGTKWIPYRNQALQIRAARAGRRAAWH